MLVLAFPAAWTCASCVSVKASGHVVIAAKYSTTAEFAALLQILEGA
jgi:hypothetical protein